MTHGNHYKVFDTETKQAAYFDDYITAADFAGVDPDEMLWAINEEGICEVGKFAITDEDGPAPSNDGMIWDGQDIISQVVKTAPTPWTKPTARKAPKTHDAGHVEMALGTGLVVGNVLFALINLIAGNYDTALFGFTAAFVVWRLY